MNFHLLKVLEIKHLDKNNKIKFVKNNINNLLHKTGEEYILKVLFGGESIPNEYYLGLDSRSVISRIDTLNTVSTNEPSLNGYSRQSISNSSFSFSVNSEDNYQANSPVVLFRATGGSWGSVNNLFLATSLTNNGYLISSVPLGANLIVANGETVSMRIGLALGTN